mgnify:CR=1 FL=1
MIKKIDIPESTAIDASVLWGGINDNVLAVKINELIDVVNKQQDIIHQIGEWGSSKDECLWCDTLTEFNPENPTISKKENVQKETFVSIDEALEMGKQDHKIRSTNERLRKALDCAVSALETISAMAAPDSSIEIYARCKRIEINALTKGSKDE